MLVLALPVFGTHLNLYLSMEKIALGALLAQKIERVEKVAYYINKKLLPYKQNYSLAEKICLDAIFYEEVEALLLVL